MAEATGVDFARNVAKALADGQLRQNLRAAMSALSQRRERVFPNREEFERLRAVGSAIRQRALSKLPELLEQLEKKCTGNGIQVHWAETTDAANRIVLDIIQAHNTRRVIMGKSLVS